MTLFEQYFEASIQIKELEARKKELSDKLLASMQEQQIGTIKSELGTLSKAQKLVYTYSDEFKEFENKLKEQVKEAKKLEEQKQEPTIQEYLTLRLK